MNDEILINRAGHTSPRGLAAMTVLTLTLANPLVGMAADAVDSGKPQRVSQAAAQDGPAVLPSGCARRQADDAIECRLTVGKSTLMPLPPAIERISVGNPLVADVTLISGGRELYLLGKTVGTTNIMLWRRSGKTEIVEVEVSFDGGRLQARLNELLPGEKDIKVSSAAESIVLSGEVSSAVKAEQAVQIAEAFVRNLNRGLQTPVTGGAPVAPDAKIPVVESRTTIGSAGSTVSRVVNMLRVSSPQQVMLEVKVAEVSKTLLDQLGAAVGTRNSAGSWTYSIISSLLGGGAGLLSAIQGPGKYVQIDAEKKDGLVKILAEPNIIAVSGQEGSFLAGGKIFIPVARTNAVSGLSTITLEEKEFGVGLKFTPTVLEGGRINLRVAPEVSELSQTGSPFTTIDGSTAILPSFTTRRAQTTVQLNDGQSFAIAGLIKSNLTETMKRFPVLGEIPILGALFRSSEFQQEQTELMFIVTPRLVKPLPPDYALPDANFVPPSRQEYFIGGRLEGADQAPAAAKAGSPAAPAKQLPPPAPAKGGFENQ